MVTITSTSRGAEVEFTLRPRNNRPRVAECPGASTFKVNFLENELLQQRVETETVLLSIQAGTVYLAPVREENEEELLNSLQDEIDAGAVTPVPRERSTFQEYGPRLGITLLSRSGPRSQADGLCLR